MFTATGEELRLARNGYVFQNKSIWIEENNTEKKTSSMLSLGRRNDYSHK